MKLGGPGLELMKFFEGDRLEAYKDGGGILTIGRGHTRFAEGFAIIGLTLTPEQVEKLFAWDLAPDETDVSEMVGVQPQYRFDAILSLAFNVGVPAVKSSTLLKLLRRGSMALAAEEFLKWDHGGGIEVAGLLNRRKAERRLFLGEAWFRDEEGKDIRVAS